jgi:hypothetical protein
MSNNAHKVEAPPAAWSISEWCRLVGNINRGTIYNLFRRGEIRLSKVGTRTVVTTDPEQYLAAHRVARQGEDEPFPIKTGQ